MTNTSVIENKANETFYTTPKMIAASISGDVIWQFISQTVDPHVKNEATLVTLSLVYPILITTLIGAAAFMHSLRKKDEEFKKDEQENKDICWAVLLGMYGWMAGYYLASYGLDYGRWACAAMAGIMSAAPLLAYSVHNDSTQGKIVSDGTYAVATSSFIFSAFGWYLAYILPREIPHSIMPALVSEMFISPAVTGAITGAGLAVLWAWEKSQAPKKKPNEGQQPAAAPL